MEIQPTDSETPVAELLELAQKKERRLTPRERRRVLKYIEEAGLQDVNGATREPTNYELAALFDVDEKIIRVDKRKLLKEYTSLLTPDDAMVFVGNFMQGHDDLLRRAFKALTKIPEGTITHVKYLMAASDLHKRRISMLQEIGALPKELGNLNTNEELWEAFILDDNKGNATSGVRRMPVPTGVLTQSDETDDEDEDEPSDGETFEAEIS